MNANAMTIPNETTQKMIDVSPSIARDWLAKFQYEKQRPIRGWHVARLRDEILAGRFMHGTQIHFASLRGKWKLVNGQHTLSAVVSADRNVTLSVLVTEVNTDEEVAELFFRHDTHLTRNIKDAFHATSLAESYGISPTTLSIISTSALWLDAVKNKKLMSGISHMTSDEKLIVVRNYLELGINTVPFFEGSANERYFRRRSTFGSAMFTYPHNGSESFWRGIVEDDGLRVGDPRKTLLAFLRNSIASNASEATNKVHRQEHQLVKGIAQAWNAWVNDRELKLIRPLFQEQKATFDDVGTLFVRGGTGK